MANPSRCAWALAAAAATGGCIYVPAVDRSPTYVVADQLVETDERLYLLELSPAARWSWPRFAGATRLAVQISAGPGFDTDADEPAEADAPRLPLTLEVDAVVPPADAAGEAALPDAWATDDEGTRWTIALDFSAPGDWIIPVRVSDAAGHEDRARLAFRIHPQPAEGRPPPW